MAWTPCRWGLVSQSLSASRSQSAPRQVVSDVSRSSAGHHSSSEIQTDETTDQDRGSETDPPTGNVFLLVRKNQNLTGVTFSLLLMQVSKQDQKTRFCKPLSKQNQPLCRFQTNNCSNLKSLTLILFKSLIFSGCFCAETSGLI